LDYTLAINFLSETIQLTCTQAAFGINAREYIPGADVAFGQTRKSPPSFSFWRAGKSELNPHSYNYG